MSIVEEKYEEDKRNSMKKVGNNNVKVGNNNVNIANNNNSALKNAYTSDKPSSIKKI